MLAKYSYAFVAMVAQGTIDQMDVDRFILSDSPKDVASLVSQVAKTKFGLAHGVMKPRWWLLEAPFPKWIPKPIPKPVASQEQGS